MPRSLFANPYSVLAFAVVVIVLALPIAWQPAKPIMSNWPAQVVGAPRVQAALEQNIVAEQAPVVSTAVPVATPISGIAKPQGVGQAALDRYLQNSALQEDAGDGSVRLFRRDVAAGALDFMVVRLNQRSHVEVINADGATPGSDAAGDTIWTDGQRHLRTVQEMANAPYAARADLDLLGAMAFGFHGEPRTSDEGTIVINNTVLRSNPGRGTVCITNERKAEIGKFSTEELSRCAQAFGGGPVILWENKVANPAVGAADGEFLPFNPLGEDFVQLDWRKQIYNGLYPKTAVGIGLLENGESYLVLATSRNMTGIDFARQLRDLGCYAALGGDDDTSTQAVWRGKLVRPGNPRPVPDAIGVYLKQ